jgi:ATP-dependent Clp protease protease subunit
MTVRPAGSVPGEPGIPRQPPLWPAQPPGSAPPPAPADPGGWPGRVYERLLERRIVIAHGLLADQSATRLCAQLLTLDAEGDQAIRLELHGLDSELPAALTVMGVLGVVGVPVHAYAAGRLSGPALGVLSSCSHRRAYPNAVFVLTEPRLHIDGSAAEITAHEQQLRIMLDTLYFKLAEVTGREVDDIRDDARRCRHLTAEQAVSCGLLQGLAESGRWAGTPGQRGTGE